MRYLRQKIFSYILSFLFIVRVFRSLNSLKHFSLFYGFEVFFAESHSAYHHSHLMARDNSRQLLFQHPICRLKTLYVPLQESEREMWGGPARRCLSENKVTAAAAAVDRLAAASLSSPPHAQRSADAQQQLAKESYPRQTYWKSKVSIYPSTPTSICGAWFLASLWI